MASEDGDIFSRFESSQQYQVGEKQCPNLLRRLTQVNLNLGSTSLAISATVVPVVVRVFAGRSQTIIFKLISNSLSLGRCGCHSESVNLKQKTHGDWYLDSLSKCYHGMNARRSRWREINIGSGNGLVSWGTKPLPKPVLVMTSDAIWRHKANTLKTRLHSYGQK